MTIEIFQLLTPLIGVLLGWLMSQLGERHKVYREDKIKLKKTLFYLLEIRRQLKIYVIDEEDINMILSMIANKNPHLKEEIELKSAQIKALIYDQIQSEMKNYNTVLSNSEIEAMKANFTKCVETLSEVDPILAFTLLSKQNIHEQINKTIEIWKQSVSSRVSDASKTESIEELFKERHPVWLRETLSSLDSVMLKIAGQIDRKTLRRTKEKFDKKRSAKSQLELEKFMEVSLNAVDIPS